MEPVPTSAPTAAHSPRGGCIAHPRQHRFAVNTEPPAPARARTTLCRYREFFSPQTSKSDANARWKAAQFDPVVKWLLKAVTAAHQSDRIRLLARKVLATGVFTRNLQAACVEVGNGEVRSAFQDLMVGVTKKRDHYGGQMNDIFISMNLKQELGKDALGSTLVTHPKFQLVRGKVLVAPAREAVRQDHMNVLGPLVGDFARDVVNWDDPQAYGEKKLLQIITMTCAAIDPMFQDTVRKRCEDACGKGKVYTKPGPIKKVARMLNKMQSDHRGEVKPRCALQIDIMRCMVGTDGPAEMKAALKALKKEFGGGFVMIKNGFEMTDEKAARKKHLRFVNVTVLYEPKGLTFGTCTWSRAAARVAARLLWLGGDIERDCARCVAPWRGRAPCSRCGRGLARAGESCGGCRPKA